MLPLCLASFTQRDRCEMHPCCRGPHQILLFHWCIIFHGMISPRCVYPSSCGWAFGLFLNFLALRNKGPISILVHVFGVPNHSFLWGTYSRIERLSPGFDGEVPSHGVGTCFAVVEAFYSLCASTSPSVRWCRPPETAVRTEYANLCEMGTAGARTLCTARRRFCTI